MKQTKQILIHNVYISSFILILFLSVVFLLAVVIVFGVISKNISKWDTNMSLGLSSEIIDPVVKIPNDVRNYQDSILENQILSYLGDRKDNYAIYLYDLTEDRVVIQHQSLTRMPSASISKLPSVILTLRDIDAGKYKLTDTITVQNSLKHTNVDAIGIYPNGSRVPISLFLEEAIRTSNNSAHYHLHDNLGGMAVVNPRTQDELRADTFYLDPLVAKAEDVGDVLYDLYHQKTLSKESNEFILDLMKNPAPSLRTAIPAGVPGNIEVANKVGFLFGGKYGNTFADAAIVYGENKDYILVVLNNKTTPFPSGSIPIREISKMVYPHMQKDTFEIN